MAKYNATFTSVWDDGLEINARCFVNKKKHLVTRVGKNDACDGIEEDLNQLEHEYVTMDSGETYKAVPEDEMENYEEEVIGY